MPLHWIVPVLVWPQALGEEVQAWPLLGAQPPQLKLFVQELLQAETLLDTGEQVVPEQAK